MKTTNLILLALNLFYLVLPVKANPIMVAQSNCQATLNSVIKEIKQKGVIYVKFEVNREMANQYHEGNPTYRNDVLKIIMGAYATTETENYRIQDVLWSSALMNSWANKIVQNCGNTAVVIFARNHSGWARDYAIQIDGKTKPRNCISPEDEDRVTKFLSWDEQYCL